MFKTIEKHGEDASILFNNIDFGKQNIYVFNRLLQDYSNKFDFNMINSTLLKTTKEITSEMTKQKLEYEQLFTKMITEIENQKQEIKDMKEKELLRIKEQENQERIRIKIIKEELEEIKKENAKQIKEMKEEFQKMIEEHKKIIKEDSVQKDHQILIEKMNVYKIKQIKEEARNEIIKEIIEKNETKQYQELDQNQIEEKMKHKENNPNKFLIQRILFLHRCFDVLSINDNENSSLYSNDFQTKMKFISDNLDKINISLDMINNFYQKNYLKRFLIELFFNYDDFSFDLIYPSKSIFQIIDIIEEVNLINPILFSKINIFIKIFEDEKDSINKENSVNNIFTLKIACQPINDEIISNYIEPYKKIITKKTTEIKEGDFKNYKFYEIKFPSYIKSIGLKAFNGYQITKITIPKSVTTIGDYAFYRCTSLKEITFEIPSSVSIIGEHAFEECSSLIGIVLPSSVKSIGAHAFRNCSSLKQVSIPSSVTSVGLMAFYYCSSLIDISLSSSLDSIDSYQFCGCSKLVKILIPSSVKSIKNDAFDYCSSLKQIIFEKPSFVSIHKESFGSCKSLTHIVNPPSEKSSVNNILYGCSSLVGIPIK